MKLQDKLEDTKGGVSESGRYLTLPVHVTLKQVYTGPKRCKP